MLCALKKSKHSESHEIGLIETIDFYKQCALYIFHLYGVKETKWNFSECQNALKIFFNYTKWDSASFHFRLNPNLLVRRVHQNHYFQETINCENFRSTSTENTQLLLKAGKKSPCPTDIILERFELKNLKLMTDILVLLNKIHPNCTVILPLKIQVYHDFYDRLNWLKTT